MILKKYKGTVLDFGVKLTCPDGTTIKIVDFHYVSDDYLVETVLASGYTVTEMFRIAEKRERVKEQLLGLHTCA